MSSLLGGSTLSRLDGDEHLQVVRVQSGRGARVGAESAREAGEPAGVEDTPERAREERQAGGRVDVDLLEHARQALLLRGIRARLEAPQRAARVLAREAAEVGDRLLADRLHERRVHLALVELVRSRPALAEP